MKTQELTIHQALAEINLLGKKMEAHKKFIVEHSSRLEDRVDPLEADGGSEKVLVEKLQALVDYGARIVKIRSAINEANQSIMLTIGNREASLAEWIVWRREVAPVLESLYGSSLPHAFRQASRNGDNASVMHIDPNQVHQKYEELVEILSDLDGQLSVINATNSIEVPM